MVGEHDLIEFPLSVAEIRDLAKEIGGVSHLLSTKSPKYRERKDTVHTDEEWIAEMAREPRLIRRPLWRFRGRLLVGFDPETWSQMSH